MYPARHLGDPKAPSSPNELHILTVQRSLTFSPELLVKGVGGVGYGRLARRHPRPKGADGVLAEGEVGLLLVGDQGGPRHPDVVLRALERAEVCPILR